MNQQPPQNVSYSLYQTIKERYAPICEVVSAMAVYLEASGYPIGEEEKFYLILHVQRLCDRERCAQPTV